MLESSGEITPPLRRARRSSLSTGPLPSPLPRATAAAASAPADPRCVARPASAASRDRCCRSSRGCRRPARGCPPRAPCTRSVSSACVALRFGRKPYDEARKSASKIGSSTSFAAICATRSRTVGMPSGRCRPSAFGMYRRRTGCGRYVPARSAALSSSSMRSTPYCSISRASRDRRPPSRGSASPAATPPAGRHASRSDPTGRGSAVPGIAWLRPRVGVAVGALCRWAGAHRGSWIRTCRSCPCASLRPRRDHRRGPSLPLALFVASDPRYYDPLGLPLRRARFRRRLIRAALPRPGLRRRASRVPFVSVHACCAPYPAETRRASLRTEARQTWPSPRHDRLGSRVVSLSRLQASR